MSVRVWSGECKSECQCECGRVSVRASVSASMVVLCVFDPVAEARQGSFGVFFFKTLSAFSATHAQQLFLLPIRLSRLMRDMQTIYPMVCATLFVPVLYTR